MPPKGTSITMAPKTILRGGEEKPAVLSKAQNYNKHDFSVKAILHIQRFERVGAVTKIDSFGSERKRL